ncbi:OmpA family protein [Afifella sp. IM 167]|uniref:OmpA family protein n=1 Tax=Afifella sp. IM 167 TaxID=2033586 RepID=UPI001CCEA2CC|nr:OmpA family protein [Afifella sp. IM 167]MBZ8134381.1 hypothetical protein [Afifella sp. IM 167]
MLVEEDLNSGTAEEGENYFVSMTDMMIGVLFIFIIMLMVFALDLRQRTDVQEDAVSIAKEVAEKLEALQARVDAEISAIEEAQKRRQELLDRIQDELRQAGLEVVVDEQHGVLRLTEQAVQFPSDSSNLGTVARENVRKIAIALSAVLPDFVVCESDVAAATGCRKTDSHAMLETLFIEGHTDETGPDERNWQLSTERAVNTYRALVEDAPLLRRLRNRADEEVVSVSGYSSTRPIDASRTHDARTLNRRIDLRFVMETDNRERLREINGLTKAMKSEIDRLRAASGEGR